MDHANEVEAPRSPEVLAPLIREQITLGYQAGAAYFRTAGALLLEAKRSLPRTQDFGQYIKALGITSDQSGDWMRLARSERQGLPHRTIREARRDRRTRGQGRPKRPAPLDDQPDSVRERSHSQTARSRPVKLYGSDEQLQIDMDRIIQDGFGYIEMLFQDGDFRESVDDETPLEGDEASARLVEFQRAHDTLSSLVKNWRPEETT